MFRMSMAWKPLRARSPLLHQSQFWDLDGAPQAGDRFNFHVLDDEKEAKQIAAKRTQLLREQNR